MTEYSILIQKMNNRCLVCFWAVWEIEYVDLRSTWNIWQLSAHKPSVGGNVCHLIIIHYTLPHTRVCVYVLGKLFKSYVSVIYYYCANRESNATWYWPNGNSLQIRTSLLTHCMNPEYLQNFPANTLPLVKYVTTHIHSCTYTHIYVQYNYTYARKRI